MIIVADTTQHGKNWMRPKPLIGKNLLGTLKQKPNIVKIKVNLNAYIFEEHKVNNVAH